MSSSKTPSSTLAPPALKPLKLNSAGLGQSTTGKEKSAPVSSKRQAPKLTPPKLNFALGGSKSTSSSKLAAPKLNFSLGETVA